MDANHSPENQAAASSPISNGNASRARGSGRKRQRSFATPDGSPESHSMDDGGHDSAEERRRQPEKRACNECRQQKLRCDVNPAPFEACSRCKRLKLTCRIDANFKRVGKRSKNAEMEREIVELRKQLADKESPTQASSNSQNFTGTFASPQHATQPNSLDALHEGIAGSLLDLRHSSTTAIGRKSKIDDSRTKTLGQLSLPGDRIDELFEQYFSYYHPFLPFLDPERSPTQYYDNSPLLFWTIITVASRRYESDPTLLFGLTSALPNLLWSTISSVPQNYHVVKALCLICTWPLPTKSTSTDPSFILVGVMMQIAMQIGLHRPSHIQDFSRIRIELREDDLRDRVKTWAACNIVAQSVSTGYGQPPKTVYDWTLMSPLEGKDNSFSLPADLLHRLAIERFCNKVTQKFYNNRSDPIGVTSDQERAAWTSLLVESYQALEHRFASSGAPVDMLHLRAARLHLRLAAFFDAPSAPNYIADLLELYLATTSFIEAALSFPNDGTGPALKYATNYLMQMLVAGGFTLLKLLNSFFATHIDVDSARRLFSSTIWAIRAISVTNNDLPGRLAEVLAQLWRSYGAASSSSAGANAASTTNNLDNLQLKVRCRMSMSLVFDSVWRWREEFQLAGGSAPVVNLDSAVNNPTNPEEGATDDESGTAAAATASTINGMLTAAPPNFLDPALTGEAAGAAGASASAGTAAPALGASRAGTATPNLFAAGAMQGDGVGAYSGAAGTGAGTGAGVPSLEDYNYEVFDPLTWMLDGEVEFPYGTNILGGQAPFYG